MLKKQITLLILIALIVGLFGMAQLCYDGSGGGSLTFVQPSDDSGDDDSGGDDTSAAACAIPADTSECRAVSYGANYQIAGSMNDWPSSGADGAMTELSDCYGLYQALYDLDAGSYEFKIKTIGAWNDSTTIGPSGGTAAEVAIVGDTADGLVYEDIQASFHTTGIGSAGGGNLSVTTTETDTYVFCAHIVADDDVRLWIQKGAEGIVSDVSVVGISPEDEATDVNWRSDVAVTFSEGMDATATEAAFTLQDSSGTSVLDQGEISWSEDGDVMTFSLNDGVYYDLGETYTVGVSTDATSSGGTALLEAFESTFTVITEEPLEYDFDSCNDPLDAADGVSYEMIGEMNGWGGGDNAFIEDSSCNGKYVGVYAFTAGTYNFKFRKTGEWNDPTTIGASETGVEIYSDGTFSSSDTYRGYSSGGGENIAMVISNDGNHEVSFQIYKTTETVSYGDPAEDVTLSPVSMGIRETDEDVTEVEPTVSSSSPEDGDTDVVVNTNVVLSFNLAMDTSSVESAFSISPDPGGGSFSWDTDEKVLTYSHSNYFEVSTDYTVTISTSATDADGNALGEAFSMTFTTSSSTISTWPGWADSSYCPDPKDAAEGITYHITGDFDTNFSMTGHPFQWSGTAVGLDGTYGNDTLAEDGSCNGKYVLSDGIVLKAGTFDVVFIDNTDSWGEKLGDFTATTDANTYQTNYSGGGNGSLTVESDGTYDIELIRFKDTANNDGYLAAFSFQAQ